MCLFLAINTSGLALLLPVLLVCSQLVSGPSSHFSDNVVGNCFINGVGVLAAKGLSKLFPSPASDADFVPPVFSERGSNIRDLIPLAIFALSLVGLVVSVYSLGKQPVYGLYLH